MTTNNEHTNAFLIHLSAFTGYFIPLGSILFPLIVWNLKKDESEYVNHHGKEAVNFNLSFLLYYTVLLITLFPILFKTIFQLVSHVEHLEHLNHFDQVQQLFSFGGWFSLFGIVVLIGSLSIFKFIIIIIAAVKAQQGEYFKYPLRINFIK
ncbi:MAG: DUF4870 domain-containing protein [Bacteroidetes bacterium]|nr:DUF4870 domain-containing protein [Bacteroidota bacterium]